MRAVVWHGKEDVRVDEVPDPVLQEDTDAIIEITSTAICGSDLHLYSKLWPVMREGDVLGHEPMGIVREVGAQVTHVRPGDRVVVPFNIACGECHMCTDHLFSQCETTRDKGLLARSANTLGRGKGASLFGYTHLYGAIPGGQAEYLRVPMAHVGLIRVPEGPPDDRFLYLSDVLPTAYQAVRYADPAPGRLLAVWGLGPIGQMAARIAAHEGVRVIGVDPVPERRAMAERYGVETVDPDAADAADAVLEMSGGRGADAVIDAVGMEASGSRVDSMMEMLRIQMDRTHALRQCMRAVRRGGTISLSGVYAGPVQMFPLGDLFDMQVQLRMGQANVLHWIPDLLPLLTDDDPVGVADLATHRLPLSAAPEAYQMFQAKRDGCVKVVLLPGMDRDASTAGAAGASASAAGV